MRNFNQNQNTTFRDNAPCSFGPGSCGTGNNNPGSGNGWHGMDLSQGTNEI